MERYILEESQKNRVAIGLVIGVLLAALESTIVATAMPQVIMDLGGSHLYSLPFSLYLLASTVSSILWGKISDIANRKHIYVLGVTIFILGSALSGLSASFVMLIICRVIQGIGAGCVTPLTFTINGELFDIQKRANVQAYMSAVWGLAGLIGPLAGGLIVDHLNWRYVFYLNIPFAIIALFFVTRYYVPAHKGNNSFKLDVWGSILFIVGSSLLVFGLENKHIYMIIIGCIAVIAAWFVEKNHPYPLLPIKSIIQLIPKYSIILNFIGGMAFFGIMAYLPLYVINVSGKGATAAGLVLTPMVVGWTVSNIIAGQLLNHIKLSQLVIIGFSFVVFGFSLFAIWYNYPLYFLSSAGFVTGCGMGFGMLGTLLSIQEYSENSEMGSSTSGLMFARSIGGSIGVALLSLILGNALNSDDIPYKQTGYLHCYIACIIIAIIGLWFSTRLHKAFININRGSSENQK